MEAAELASQRAEEELLKVLGEKKKLAEAYKRLTQVPEFQEVILKHFLGTSLKDNLRRQYDEEDQEGNAARREVYGRVCLQKFLDTIDSDAGKAEAYIDNYNQLRGRNK